MKTKTHNSILSDANTGKRWGCLKTIIVFIVTICAILFGGLGLSKWIATNDRSTVDKHGLVLKAVVVRKNSNSKGQSTFYKFRYKNKEFISNEGGADLYNMYSIGDTITIRIDTTDPENTYVIFSEGLSDKP